MPQIQIDPICEKIIHDYAVVAYMHMRKPTTYTVDDMIQEGFLVLIKDVLPKHVPIGKPGYKASLKTYLRTCLRNHFVDLMKKSFRCSEEANERYEKYRTKRHSASSNDQSMSMNLMIDEFMGGLSDEEMKYLNLLLKRKTRIEIRSEFGISLRAQRKMKKNIINKIIGR